MIRSTIKFWLPLILLACFPAVAYANAGTVFIFPILFHLVLGNALVGIAEGLVLARLFRRNAFLCIGIMIAANYFSTWAGGFFLMSRIEPPSSLDLYSARPWILGMVGIIYVVTLLLEWPFVALCLRKSESWFRKSIWGSLLVQSASYVVLIGLYCSASAASLYTDLTVVRPSAMSLLKHVTIYYIAENDEEVCALELSAGESQTIGRVESSIHKESIFLRESRTAAERWNLLAGAVPEDPNADVRIVAADLMCTAAEPSSLGYDRGYQVPRFRADTSGWQFRMVWWAGRLYGKNAEEERSAEVSMATPFVTWLVRHPTQLPNGQVVFQLGKDQICILDPDEKTIALLVKGWCPVVTMSDKTAE